MATRLRALEGWLTENFLGGLRRFQSCLLHYGGWAVGFAGVRSATMRRFRSSLLRRDIGCVKEDNSDPGIRREECEYVLVSRCKALLCFLTEWWLNAGVAIENLDIDNSRPAVPLCSFVRRALLCPNIEYKSNSMEPGSRRLCRHLGGWRNSWECQQNQPRWRSSFSFHATCLELMFCTPRTALNIETRTRVSTRGFSRVVGRC